MASSGLSEYFQFLAGGLNQPGEFIPTPFYDSDSDTLSYYAQDEATYAKRMNELVTLFLAIKDNSLIGVKVKGVRRLCQKLAALNKSTLLDWNCEASASEDGTLRILLELATIPKIESEELEHYGDELKERFGQVPVRKHLQPLCM